MTCSGSETVVALAGLCTHANLKDDVERATVYGDVLCTQGNMTVPPHVAVLGYATSPVVDPDTQ